ncbi:hypothetical protein [uncultured Roseobacter sp.]|uniref:hypothetical protein n=1 Tax=uncultured Roseobacter sp. TaxID=114847 RepID=UPI0026028415|nr:hypothetical protein [uncultured Roseobacter sp.]
MQFADQQYGADPCQDRNRADKNPTSPGPHLTRKGKAVSAMGRRCVTIRIDPKLHDEKKRREGMSVQEDEPRIISSEVRAWLLDREKLCSELTKLEAGLEIGSLNHNVDGGLKAKN